MLHAILFSGGLEWQAAYPLPTESNKTLQLQPGAQPGFCKGQGGGLKQKLECFCLKKVAIGQHVEHTGAIQTNWVDGSLRGNPTVARWAIFAIFGKNNHFNVIWIIFQTFLKPFKRTKLLGSGIKSKKLNCLAFSAPLFWRIKF